MPSTGPRGLGGDSSKKVAIIVVHGVSDQQPYDSARTIANLLLHTNEEQRHAIEEQHHTNEGQRHANEEQRHAIEGQPRYSVWLEQFIRIPVRPIPKCQCQDPEASGQPEAASSLKRLLGWLFGWLDERGERIRRYLDSGYPSAANQTIEDKLDKQSHAFTCDFVESYNPQKDIKASFYDTICLKACRDDKHEVHLYEMYWADLSRLGRGFVEVFSEFFQILFHLSALGRHTLDMAALEHPGRWWRLYSSLHGWAGRILSIPIPLLSLFLLIAAFLSIPGNISPSLSSYLAPIILSLGVIALLGYVFWYNAKKLPLPWLVLLVIVALAVIVSSWFREFSYKLLAFEWLVLLTIPTLILINKYSLRRPGTDKVAIGLGFGLAAFAFWNLLGGENSPIGITKASFMLIEVIYFLLAISWVSFFWFYFFVEILGWFVRAKLTDKNAKERAKRASWTASVSLWIPSVSFIAVTLALWTALAKVGSSLLPKGYDKHFPTPWFKNWLLDKDSYEPSEFFNEIIVNPSFGIVVFSIMIVLPLIAWSFLPSAWAEVQPPDSTTSTKQPVLDEQLSLKFGIWLNNGYRAVYNFLPLVSAFFSFLVVSYFLLLYLFPDFAPVKIIRNIDEPLEGVIQWSAVIISTSATSILVLGKRLDQLSLGIRNIIDVILDVDNYLRLHPKYDNPRARIFSRYSSLLRYLCQETDTQNQPKYDALIVVAHSQGTVITADLLRFIQYEKPQGLERLFSTSRTEKIPVYFFSMGSPLRQLYSVGFPHLYNWVINYAEDYGTEDKLGNKPKPKNLGLEQWVNTFRSGDYVGRYLWQSSIANEKKLFQPSSSVEETNNISEKDKYREFCLGAGAHTHYWDATANRVADEINRLIDKATIS